MLYYDGKGRYQKECALLWNQFVPDAGQAATVQGELVRASAKLESEYIRNGNGNWDMGFRMFTNFLLRHLNDLKVFSEDQIGQIQCDISDIRAFGNGTKAPDFSTDDEDAFDRITDRVVEWCLAHPNPIVHVHNPKLKR